MRHLKGKKIANFPMHKRATAQGFSFPAAALLCHFLTRNLYSKDEHTKIVNTLKYRFMLLLSFLNKEQHEANKLLSKKI